MRFSELTPRRSPFSSSLTPLWSFPNAFDADRFETEMDEFMRDSDLDRDIAVDVDYGARAFPCIDVKETSDKYSVDAELPGVTAKEVEIEAVNNSLFIKGEIGRVEQKEGGYICAERCYGPFFRKISFDQDVNVDSIDAQLKDGVLHIEIKKKNIEIPKSKKIDIHQ